MSEEDTHHTDDYTVYFPFKQGLFFTTAMDGFNKDILKNQIELFYQIHINKRKHC